MITGLRVDTAPAQEVVSLEEAKAFLNVDGTTDDDLITSLCVAAREYCEAFTRRAFITTTFIQTFDHFAFPYWMPNRPNVQFARSIYDNSRFDIELARPAQEGSVTIAYKDADGTPSTFADFDLDYTTEPARIRPKIGKDWPTTDGSIAAIEITFDSGYGDDPTDVPTALRLAIKNLVALWYRDREADQTDVPESIHRLLWSHRVLTA